MRDEVFREEYVYLVFDYRAIPLYVGVGRDDRYRRHEKDARNGEDSFKSRVIRKTLKVLGSLPVVIIADNLTIEEAFEIEIALISAIGRRPHGPLVNLTAGGEGMASPPSEVVERIKASLRRVKADPENKRIHSEKTRQGLARPGVKEAISAASKKSMKDPVVKAVFVQHAIDIIRDPEKLAARGRAIGKALSQPEEKRRRGAASRAHLLSGTERALAHRAAITAANQRLETRKKRSDSCTVWANSPENKLRVSTWARDTWKDPVIRAKRLAGMMAANERRRVEKEKRNERTKEL